MYMCKVFRLKETLNLFPLYLHRKSQKESIKNKSFHRKENTWIIIKLVLSFQKSYYYSFSRRCEKKPLHCITKHKMNKGRSLTCVEINIEAYQKAFWNMIYVSDLKKFSKKSHSRTVIILCQNFERFQ